MNAKPHNSSLAFVTVVILLILDKVWELYGSKTIWGTSEIILTNSKIVISNHILFIFVIAFIEGTAED